jgi:hypothetical protein
MDAPPGSGKKVSRTAALAIAILFAGAVAIVVWLIADDAGLTMGDTVIPVLVGGAVGLVVASVLVLAVSRFRAASRECERQAYCCSEAWDCGRRCCWNPRF